MAFERFKLLVNVRHMESVVMFAGWSDNTINPLILLEIIQLIPLNYFDLKNIIINSFLI